MTDLSKPRMNNFKKEDLRKIPVLNIPYTRVRLRYFGSILKIFDRLRNRFVALTPEEYVRQQFTGWMINFLEYPPSLMANEVSLNLYGTTKRCDTVVYNSDGTILMIVEFKAPDVSITQDVFDQIMRYNLALKAKILVVSNGISHYCCLPNYNSETYHFLDQIPNYKTAKEIV